MDPGIAGTMGCGKTRYYELMAENTELYEYDETTQELVPIYKNSKLLKENPSTLHEWLKYVREQRKTRSRLACTALQDPHSDPRTRFLP